MATKTKKIKSKRKNVSLKSGGASFPKVYASPLVAKA